jgi:drug/metabolite transporter, DME family
MSDNHSPRQVRVGRLLLLAAAIFWSTSGVLVKNPAMASVPSDARGPILACFRALIAGVFLLPFVSWRRVRFRPAMVPMVVSFAAMNVLFLSAMTLTSAAAAIFLQYTATGWAFVFGVVVLKERASRENLVALIFSWSGIWWIVAGEWNGTQFFGTMLALGSGLAYGGVIVSLRHLHDEDSAWLVALNHLVSGAVLVPWAFSLEYALDATQWSVIAALGVLQMALPYVLFARAVRWVAAQEAGLIVMLEAVLNPLWVWLFWGEQAAPSVWIGGGLILTGLLTRFLVLRERRAGSP